MGCAKPVGRRASQRRARRDCSGHRRRPDGQFGLQLQAVLRRIAQKMPVRGATDGAQAQALRPALVLVDIQMPHVDGLTLIRQMRADAALAATPIIALTALAMPSDRDRCLEAGANDYLSKPVKFDDMLRAMSALLPPP